ncbi:GntR family transcriptional regulator [Sediminihabitans luteus]|nr:GntR family transcriptional regulator [Sediminihabitans luteus]
MNSVNGPPRGTASADGSSAVARAGTHKYLAVRDYLTNLVVRELRVGDAIPSERALTERFGVSRMTVRQAVDALVTEGVLERAQGRGTFVAPQRMDFELRLTTFGEEMARRGMEPTTTVLAAQTVEATTEVATELEIAPGDDVHFLYRVRSADGAPMSIEQVWVPVALVPALFGDGPPASVYEALREHGQAPAWGEQTLEAADASDAEASLLGLGASRAVLRAKRRTFSETGPCMYSHASYRSDRYSVWVPLKAPGPAIVPRGRERGGAAAGAPDRAARATTDHTAVDQATSDQAATDHATDQATTREG